MSFTTGAALLDAVVLAVVSREEEGTYGYKITQEIKQALELSESTLYPVLRRLQRDGCLTIYDEPFNGRNRRYYKITPLGRQQLAGYKAEWKVYAANIDHILGRMQNDKAGIYAAAGSSAGRNAGSRTPGCPGLLRRIL